MPRIPCLALALTVFALSQAPAKAAEDAALAASDVSGILGLAGVGDVRVEPNALRLAAGRIEASGVTGTAPDGKQGAAPARFGSVTVLGARPEDDGRTRAYDLVEIRDAEISGNRYGRITMTGLRLSPDDRRFEAVQVDSVTLGRVDGMSVDAVRLTTSDWASGMPGRHAIQVRGLRPGGAAAPLLKASGFPQSIDLDLTGSSGKDGTAPESATIWIGSVGVLSLAASGLTVGTGEARAAEAVKAVGAGALPAPVAPDLSLSKGGGVTISFEDKGFVDLAKSWMRRGYGTPADLVPAMAGAALEARMPSLFHPDFKASLGAGVRAFLAAPGNISIRIAAPGADPGASPLLRGGQGKGVTARVDVNRPAR